MNLTDPIFTDADKAREHLEAVQWPNGPVCPHCGNVDAARITKLAGKSTRPGVYKCKECEKPFTVTVGTVFERSHIALNLWLLASALMASSKKGFSAHQMHRSMGITYKSAWFMEHRLREAMKETC
jgi:transposase-like protein